MFRRFAKPTYILNATTTAELRHEIVRVLRKRQMNEAAELIENAILQDTFGLNDMVA